MLTSNKLRKFSVCIDRHLCLVHHFLSKMLSNLCAWVSRRNGKSLRINNYCHLVARTVNISGARLSDGRVRACCIHHRATKRTFWFNWSSHIGFPTEVWKVNAMSKTTDCKLTLLRNRAHFVWRVLREAHCATFYNDESSKGLTDHETFLCSPQYGHIWHGVVFRVNVTRSDLFIFHHSESYHNWPKINQNRKKQ